MKTAKKIQTPECAFNLLLLVENAERQVMCA